MGASHRLATQALLHPRRGWLFARAWLMLAIVDLRLRVFGFRRVAARGPDPGHRLTGPDDLRRAFEHARWLRVAARRHVVRARCLHQALALHHRLRHERLPSELRIGVRTADGELRAHAWVELAGHVLDEHPAAVRAFTALTSARAGRGSRPEPSGAGARSILSTMGKGAPLWS